MSPNAAYVTVELEDGSNDEALQSALSDLLSDLSDAIEVEVSEVAEPKEKSKGGATDIILAVGASGGTAALVRIFRLWLSRDRFRSLTMRQVSGGQEKIVKISGENLALESIEQAVRAVWKNDEIAR